MTKHTAFWDDLARDLEDPEFLREYVAASTRIATTRFSEERSVSDTTAAVVSVIIMAVFAITYGVAYAVGYMEGRRDEWRAVLPLLRAAGVDTRKESDL